MPTICGKAIENQAPCLHNMEDVLGQWQLDSDSWDRGSWNSGSLDSAVTSTFICWSCGHGFEVALRENLNIDLGSQVNPGSMVPGGGPVNVKAAGIMLNTSPAECRLVY